MQEIIERMIEGSFEQVSGSLDFSCTEIHISLQKGGCYEGEFQIHATPGCFTTGHITTSDFRMECLTPNFTGTLADIAYRFHGEQLEEGEEIKGSFYVVSSQGEYYLPFVASVEHGILDSSVGPVKNLFHFANLAKSNWKEALRLFYSPEFQSVFKGSDRKHYDSYRGLSVYANQEQNMEEFLIQMNKKQKVEFLTAEASIELDILPAGTSYDVLEREIALTRNGWGYTVLNVECDGDFLFTEKQLITEDDFLGNSCRFSVYIDSSSCRQGRNFGQVLLYNSYGALTIPITVKMGESNPDGVKRMKKKRNIVQLSRYYQAFRMKKINTVTWLKETGGLVEKLLAMDERDVAARLFKAQLLITGERYKEADRMLEQAGECMGEKPDEELWAYYLYLTTLLRREEAYVNEIAGEVERIYRREKKSWRIAWLLLYLSEEYNKSAAVKWQFLKKQFENGCRSFIIYIEALGLLNSNPMLLRSLGSFELQVLHYGVRQEALLGGVVEQLLYLSGKVREYHSLLCKILQGLYHQKPDSGLLQEICTLLIKGGKTGEDYFEWYRRGVEEQLRITNLYEYFMMSLDRSSTQNLPRVVLLYFSYQSNLDYEHMAFLYDYVLEHRQELGELYENYRPRMEHFIMEQIRREHINLYLARLYTKLLIPETVGEQIAKPLSRLLFAHFLRAEDLRMKKVLVYYPNCVNPREYSLVEGRCWLPLYGNEYTIVFEDAWGNRFVKNIGYTLEKLMSPGRLLRSVTPFVKDSPELDYYLFELDNGLDEITAESVECAMRLVTYEEMIPEVRRELTYRLLQYFYETDALEVLDVWLERITPEEFSVSERAGILKYMVLRGQYGKAYDWIEGFGPYFVELSTLVRLVSALVSEDIIEERPVLTAAAVYVFRRSKYNHAILEYLCRHFSGMSKDMRDIWKTARDFGVDCYYLSERILLQMLYTGAFVGEKMEIFRYYVSQGAKQEVETAFLNQCAYDYFVKERVTDGYVFREIQNMYRRGEHVQKVCKLAYLKFYAENPEELGEQNTPVMQAWIQDMMAERIHLNFFRELKGCAGLIRELMDKTIIEYRARPGSRARIHYMITHDNGEAQEYLSEYMKDAFGGVCYKEFVLFFGETLQYYIMEEYDDKEQLTESGTVQNNDIGMDGEGAKYDLINDMVISKNLQDYDMLDETLETYYRREYYNEQLFALR
ncbi:MAG: DUF5717 family protein [Roseburia sp.]|nr:DUF5717 family protein [Roseburia sp.]